MLPGGSPAKISADFQVRGREARGAQRECVWLLPGHRPAARNRYRQQGHADRGDTGNPFFRLSHGAMLARPGLASVQNLARGWCWVYRAKTPPV